MICLAFHCWYHAVVIIVLRFTVGTVINAREREREKRGKDEIIGDRFISRPHSRITCGFFTKFNPTAVEGINVRLATFS